MHEQLLSTKHDIHMLEMFLNCCFKSISSILLISHTLNIFLVSTPITLLEVNNVVAYYSKDRVGEEIPLHLSKRECILVITKNILVLEMELVIC